jgi:hypothetical protein
LCRLANIEQSGIGGHAGNNCGVSPSWRHSFARAQVHRFNLDRAQPLAAMSTPPSPILSATSRA